MPPRLARMGVREVQLDLHSCEGLERVGDRVGVVRICAGVAHDRRATATCAVDRVDEIALVVRLQVLELVSVLRGRLGGDAHERGERRRAVVLGFPLTEQVQVRPRQQQDETHVMTPIAANALSTAARSASSTRSIPFGPGNTNVSPPADFLSRAMRATRASAWRPGGASVGSPIARTSDSARSTAAGGMRSSAAARCIANTRPIATASPCARSYR